jgi:hypothetical protein
MTSQQPINGGAAPHAGNGASEQRIEINPAEVAAHALMFLGRVDFKRHERQAFDMVEALLQGIASGRVVLASREAPPGEEASPPDRAAMQ